MSKKVIEDIFEELRKAEKEFPWWPKNIFNALAIVGEEYGETQKAALEAKYENKPIEEIYKKACQTAAMSFRFLLGWPYDLGENEQVLKEKPK